MAEQQGLDFENSGGFWRDPFGDPPTVDEVSRATKDELLDAEGALICPCHHPLRHVFSVGISLEALELWLKRAPEAASIQDSHGNVVLSQVGESAPEDQAILITRCTPSRSLLLLDADGDTPLHCVLQNRASTQVLWTTIKKCPDKVFSTANKIGRLPLHDAIVNDAALDVINLLVERSPTNALATADVEGRLPIHLLTSHSLPEVASLLVRLSSPNAMLQKDNNEGMSPLHCAIYSNAHIDVITVLVDKSPDSLHASDKNGRLPLHLLLEQSWSRLLGTSSIRLLLGTRPQAVLRTRDRLNRLPLAIAIRNDAGPEVVKLLLDYSPRNILTANIFQGRIPLACAVEKSSNLEVVEMLTNQSSPHILARPNKQGKLPLHYIRRSTSVEIVEFLAAKSPEVLLKPDANGKLPIHYAIHRGAMGVVEVLVERCPAPLSVADNHGQLPIHVMASASEHVKRMLIHHCNVEDLLRADKDGRLPLHRAVKAGPSSAELIDLFLNRCPAALFHFDKNGRLPLFYATVGIPYRGSRRFQPIWVEGMIRYVDVANAANLLAERAPETIGLMDPHGRVLLHDLCEYKVPMDIVKLLVRLCPAALHHADDQGRLPLHYAIERKCLSEMVQVFLEGFPGAATLQDKRGRLPLYIACDARASLTVIFELIQVSPR